MPTNYPDNYRRVINQELEDFLPRARAESSIVYKAMRYSLFSGGKRFRPVLTLLTTEATGGDYHAALPAACAIEYIHTYSLIHDDLPAIDDDSLRRGRDACHIKFGEDIALLAGDALLTEAFALIASHQESNEAKNTILIIEELAKAAGVTGMIAGQVEDIHSTGKRLKLDDLKRMHDLKTGRLIIAAARLGAVISGASAASLAEVTEYAYNIGLAFQVTDDILDVVGDTSETGKNRGSDAKLNKSTFPEILGIDESREYARELVERAKRALQNGNIAQTAQLRRLADFILARRG